MCVLAFDMFWDFNFKRSTQDFSQNPHLIPVLTYTNINNRSYSSPSSKEQVSAFHVFNIPGS